MTQLLVASILGGWRVVCHHLAQFQEGRGTIRWLLLLDLLELFKLLMAILNIGDQGLETAEAVPSVLACDILGVQPLLVDEMQIGKHLNLFYFFLALLDIGHQTFALFNFGILNGQKRSIGESLEQMAVYIAA